MGGRHTFIPCSICNVRLVRRGRVRCWDCYLVHVGRSPGTKRFAYDITEAGCWEWSGSKDIYGYGLFYKKGFPELAHRASWVIHRGPIPNGMDLLHSCDNPPCVNPEHLFPGTQADNNRDRDRKGRHAHGERSPHAKITEAQAMEIIRSSEPSKVLASRFGVHPAYIPKIKRGIKWAHLQQGSVS